MLLGGVLLLAALLLGGAARAMGGGWEKVLAVVLIFAAAVLGVALPWRMQVVARRPAAHSVRPPLTTTRGRQSSPWAMAVGSAFSGGGPGGGHCPMTLV